MLNKKKYISNYIFLFKNKKNLFIWDIYLYFCIFILININKIKCTLHNNIIFIRGTAKITT